MSPRLCVLIYVHRSFPLPESDRRNEEFGNSHVPARGDLEKLVRRLFKSDAIFVRAYSRGTLSRGKPDFRFRLIRGNGDFREDASCTSSCFLLWAHLSERECVCSEVPVGIKFCVHLVNTTCTLLLISARTLLSGIIAENVANLSKDFKHF